MDSLQYDVLCVYRDRVQSVVYASETKQLVSGGDDAVVVFWNADVKREEVPTPHSAYFCLTTSNFNISTSEVK